MQIFINSKSKQEQNTFLNHFWLVGFCSGKMTGNRKQRLKKKMSLMIQREMKKKQKVGKKIKNGIRKSRFKETGDWE